MVRFTNTGRRLLMRYTEARPFSQEVNVNALDANIHRLSEAIASIQQDQPIRRSVVVTNTLVRG